MREKNVKRAAKALFEQQDDDKNATLSKKIVDPQVRKAVADQGRVMIMLEKLLLPFGKEDYSQEEIEQLLFKKLIKKGHKIQADDVEDDEVVARDKEVAMQRRYERVHGKDAIRPKEEKKVKDHTFDGNTFDSGLGPYT